MVAVDVGDHGRGIRPFDKLRANGEQRAQVLKADAGGGGRATVELGDPLESKEGELQVPGRLGVDDALPCCGRRRGKEGWSGEGRLGSEEGNEGKASNQAGWFKGKE